MKQHRFPKLNAMYYLWRRNNWMFDPRSYLRYGDDIPINQPVFLLGVQGGGLTLLSRILRRHPSVVSVTGSSRYWSGADEIHTVLGPLLPRELTGTRFKVPFSGHPVYTPPLSWTYACDELLPFFRKTSADSTPQLKRTFTRLIRMTLAKYSIDEECSRFIDKSQVYTVRVSLINELLRDHNPKFVLVLMNPYVICYKAAQGRAADMERLKKKLSFEARLNICAQHWSNSLKCALEDRKENMMIVRFEDVLADSVAVITNICDFIGLDFRRDMLPRPEQKIPFGSRFLDRWYPLDPQRNQEIPGRMRERERRIIESRCKEQASAFGYGRGSLGDEP